MTTAIAMGGLGMLSSGLSSASQAGQIESQAQAQELQAVASRQQGSMQATQVREQGKRAVSAAKASAAGSGVRVDTGSVLDVLEESAFNIEKDARTVEMNAERQAFAQEQSASNIRAGKPSTLSTLLGMTGAGVSGYATGLKLENF